jgi:uncharacterized membrane protein
MNAAHLHLMLNHLPVVGSLGTLLLLLLAMARRSTEVGRAAMMAMVLVAIVTVPTYLTGQPAEKRIEHLPGVTESVIEPHEDNAKIALAGALVLGVIALVGLFGFRDRPAPGWLTGLLLILNLAVAVQFGRTASFGGQIRHTEIRPGAAAMPADTAAVGAREHAGEHEAADGD